MARSIKLKNSDYWDASGIYDTEQEKTQDQINAEAIAAIDTAQHLPYPGQNGNWMVWDANTGAYVDSGEPSRGEDGASASTVAAAVEAWLGENITVEEGVAIDSSLSVSGAAADAAATGTQIGDVAESNLRNIMMLADGKLENGIFVNGYITSAGNLSLTGTSRLVTNKMQQYPFDVIIKTKENSYANIFYYSNDTISSANKISASNIREGESLTIPAGTRFAFYCNVYPNDAESVLAPADVYSVVELSTNIKEQTGGDSGEESSDMDETVTLLSDQLINHNNVELTKLYGEFNDASYDSGGLTFTWSADKSSCTVVGTSTSNRFSNIIVSTNKLPDGMTPGNDLLITVVSPDAKNVFIFIEWYSNGTISSSMIVGADTVVTIPDDADGCRIRLRADRNKTYDLVVSNIHIYNYIGDRLPKYWRRYLANKMSDLITFETALAQRGIEFLFVTDTHIPENQMHSPQIIKYLYERLSFPFVINGGDWLNTDHTRADALALFQSWRSAMSGVPEYAVIGNHDRNALGSAENQEANRLSSGEFYRLFNSKMENFRFSNFERAIHASSNVSSDSAVCSYLIDNDQQKVRIIVLSTTFNRQNAENTWFREKMMEKDSTWTVLVLTHYMWAGQETATLHTVGEAIIDTINEILTSNTPMQAAFAGVIAGHSHCDRDNKVEGGYVFNYTKEVNGESVAVETTTIYPVIATICDGMMSKAAYSYTRTVGTTTEQAMDLVTLDTNTRTIRLFRIGAGDTFVGDGSGIREYSY